MPQLEQFLARWVGSSGSEKANSQMFFTELCDVLGLPRPSPATNDPAKDDYVFERRIFGKLAAGGERVGWIDWYRKGCFVLESKQGATSGGRGFAKRDTPGWNIEMQNALGQARSYALTLEELPPLLVVVDVGHVFELHATFDGSTHWRPYPDPPSHRIFLRDLQKPEKLAVLRNALSNPGALDPSKRQARVTRDIAEKLAELAKTFEKNAHPPEVVARFLMRCLFTMFAEDVGLFECKKKIFQEYIEQYWIKNPAGFVSGVGVLWKTMNTGGELMTGERVHRFNGGLFADHSALPMTKAQLETLLAAAKHDWSDVEPAIFGTLLERALDAKERHALGAHYTPREYVERLVRPALEEPLRAEWLVVRAESRQLIERSNGKTPRVVAKAEQAALAVLREFHSRLCKIRVLDPACGTGNFLYVSLDLMKQLEGEVLEEIRRVGGERSELLELETITVGPAQFLGIEKKPWAREIAELVLWIGYLRWQWRLRGTTVIGAGPVLEDAKNIECRDAVLEWDRANAANSKRGVEEKEASRRGAIKASTYPNARPAHWPDADYIIGNPPFIGKLHMLHDLGPEYVAALREAYAGQVNDGADFVVYWWHRAAEAVGSGRSKRFGLITTKSITQPMNRRVVIARLTDETAPISLLAMTPNHPWIDSQEGAQLRIAFTVGIAGRGLEGQLTEVVGETSGEDEMPIVTYASKTGVIHADGRVGVSILDVLELEANANISSTGFLLGNRGFVIDEASLPTLRLSEAQRTEIIFELFNGKDITDRPRGLYAIDATELDELELETRYPYVYQHLLSTVQPERQSNRDPRLRREWWKFRRSNEQLRNALVGLKRCVVTSETAKHRVFVMQPARTRPEHKLVVIAVEDAWILGVLSSRAHTTWALEAGGNLGVGDDPVYSKTKCFDPFPFPILTEEQATTIGDIAERLDAHRKRQLAEHPKLTITGMYNVLEKLRSGEALNDADKIAYDDGLVAVLHQLHNKLDAAVFAAYNWPPDLTDEQIVDSLIALNAERAAEEATGVVHWLRPDFQKTREKSTRIDSRPPSRHASTPAPAIGSEPITWPDTFFDRASAVRDVVDTIPGEGVIDAALINSHFEITTAKRSATRAAEVAGILDTFCALGHLMPLGTGQYMRPARAGT